MSKIKDIGKGCVLTPDAKMAINSIIEKIERNDLNLTTTQIVLEFIIEGAEVIES